MTQNKSRCLGVNHITLAVTCIERSFVFYTETLGFEPKAKWSTGAYLVAGDTWVALHLEKNKPAVTPSGYTHVAFTFSDAQYQCLREMCHSGRLTTWQENHTEGDSLYFIDPDGHQLEAYLGTLESRLRHAAEKPWDEITFFGLRASEK